MNRQRKTITFSIKTEVVICLWTFFVSQRELQQIPMHEESVAVVLSRAASEVERGRRGLMTTFHLPLYVQNTISYVTGSVVLSNIQGLV